MAKLKGKIPRLNFASDYFEESKLVTIISFSFIIINESNLDINSPAGTSIC